MTPVDAVTAPAASAPFPSHDRSAGTHEKDLTR